ncbi:MAG TPA: AlpA family phage regulatory protein [Kofleriaceae bacterium]|nr:AlpA family phage regulatory protein [Kofleriaceae bacterium]
MPTLENAFNPNTQQPEPVLDINEVKTLTHRGRSAIYAGMKAGTFPKCIKLGTRSLWYQREIATHIANAPRIVQRTGQGA